MKKLKGRERRHKRIKKRLLGTHDRPRMVIYRSHKNIYVQLVDDVSQKTLISLSTNAPSLREKIGYGGNVKAASSLGESLAKKALAKGIKSASFDRSGYKFHGRIKALAESAGKNGLSFGKKEGDSKVGRRKK